MVELHDGCQVYPGFTHRFLTFSDQVREVVTYTGWIPAADFLKWLFIRWCNFDCRGRCDKGRLPCSRCQSFPTCCGG